MASGGLDHRRACQSLSSPTCFVSSLWPSLPRWARPPSRGLFTTRPLLLTLPLGGFCLWWLYGRLKTEPVRIPDEGTYHGTHYGLACLGLAILVGLQLALQYHLHVGQATTHGSSMIPLESLPNSLGPWHGRPHPEAAKIADQATFADETLTRIYTDDHGNAVALYLVSSSIGRDREHHPEICLRDAGAPANCRRGGCRSPSAPGRPALRLPAGPVAAHHGLLLALHPSPVAAGAESTPVALPPPAGAVRVSACKFR